MNISSLKSQSLFIFLLIGVTVFIYSVGIDTRFILDDIRNLRDLANITNDGYLDYIFNGEASPLGRPISYLSFALQHDSWPNNPSNFKLINVIIHIVNGALVYIVTHLLLKQLRYKSEQYEYFPLVISALWLLHPVHSTTVLYVVQRMTLLASFFSLSGVALYLYFRNKYLIKRQSIHIIYMIVVVAGCSLISVLCKEIGVLLPAYIMVIENTLYSNQQHFSKWKKCTNMAMLLPLLAVCLYFISSFGSIKAGYLSRDFTLEQRLLTELVVLVDYIKIIIIPTTDSFSLYHDSFPISVSFFQPVKTIYSFLIILFLFLLAWMSRKKYPLIGFGVTWFFVGHSLEGTILSLELYYEHRNYLPSIGVIAIIIGVYQNFSGRTNVKKIKYYLAAIYLLCITSVTFIINDLWNSPYIQTMSWLKQQPDSQRVLSDLWGMSLVMGNKEKANDIYEKLKLKNKQDLFPDIRKIMATYCIEKDLLDENEWGHIYSEAKQAVYKNTSLISEFDQLIYLMAKNNCTMQDKPKLYELLTIIISNPSFETKKAQFYEFATTVSVLNNNLIQARNDIEAAIEYSATIHNKIYLLRILIALNENEDAAILLAQIKKEISSNLLVKASDIRKLTEIEKQLTLNN